MKILFPPLKPRLWSARSMRWTSIPTGTSDGGDPTSEDMPPASLEIAMTDESQGLQGQLCRERNDLLFDGARDIILFVTTDGTVIDANRAAEEAYGYDKSELVGMRISDLRARETIGEIASQLAQAAKEGITFETLHRRKDGSVFPVEVSARGVLLAGNKVLFSIIRDISERKAAERSLIEREEQMRLVTENMVDIVAQVAEGGALLYVSPSVEHVLGFKPGELIGTRAHGLAHPDDLEQLEQVIRQAVQEHRPFHVHARARRRDGEYVWLECTGREAQGQEGQPFSIVVGLRDITERVSKAEMLRSSEERFKRLFDTMQQGVIYFDREGRITAANPAVEEFLGLSLPEVIGRRLDDPVFKAIGEDGQGIPRELLPVRQALSGQEVRNFTFAMINQKKEMRWLSVNATPEGNNGGFIIISDITDLKRTQMALEESLNQAKNTLRGVVEALATASEKKDPYTAGHQHRVGGLAVAIASHLGLSQDAVEGLRVACELHDIGKITVPADLLSKPGRLTEVERMLIQTHVEAGYDILKEIDFPWPVAEIILQHHERLDGSGYPRGLTGDDIRIEARILAVADVAEAMMSHRPYRPALSFSVVKEELTQNKGRLYDPEVVDACLYVLQSFATGGEFPY